MPDNKTLPREEVLAHLETLTRGRQYRAAGREMAHQLMLGLHEIDALLILKEKARTGEMPYTVGDLVKEMSIFNAQGSRIVGALTAANYIETSLDAKDKRRVLLKITQNGVDAIYQAAENALTRQAPQ